MLLVRIRDKFRTAFLYYSHVRIVEVNSFRKNRLFRQAQEAYSLLSPLCAGLALEFILTGSCEIQNYHNWMYFLIKVLAKVVLVFPVLLNCMLYACFDFDIFYTSSIANDVCFDFTWFDIDDSYKSQKYCTF